MGGSGALFAGGAGGYGDGIEVADGTDTGEAEVADGELGWDGGAAGGEKEEE